MAKKKVTRKKVTKKATRKTEPSKSNNPIFMDGVIVTPAGIANWPKLDTPDNSFNKNQYKVDLVLDPNDPEYDEFCATIAEFETECGNPVEIPTLIKYTDDGAPVIKAVRNADKKDAPPVVGPDKQPISGRIRPGDTIRLALSVAFWDTNFGLNTKPYLAAVQLIERGEFDGGGAAAAFDTFDDVEIDEDTESETDFDFPD